MSDKAQEFFYGAFRTEDNEETEGDVSKFQRGDRVLVEAYYYDHVEGRPGPKHRVRAAWQPDDITPEEQPDGYMSAGSIGYSGAAVTPHPGVDVADLLEELDGAWELIFHLRRCFGLGRPPSQHGWTNDRVAALEGLRAAREATNKPQYAEGDEVWVRAEVTTDGGRVPIRDNGSHVAVRLKGQLGFSYLPADDIRPVDDDEK